MSAVVVYRNVEPHPTHRKLLEGAAKRLQRAFRGIVSIDWTFEAERHEILARCRVKTRGHAYRAAGRAARLPEAVRDALDRLATQRRRDKRIRVSKKRRPT